MARHQGHTEQAIDRLQESEKLLEALDIKSDAQADDDLWGLGMALSGLGDVVFPQGDVDAARPAATILSLA